MCSNFVHKIDTLYYLYFNPHRTILFLVFLENEKVSDTKCVTMVIHVLTILSPLNISY